MILYYREKNGDFLAIDTDTNAYYRQVFGQDHFEGRATAIAGLVGSVCTTGISQGLPDRELQAGRQGQRCPPNGCGPSGHVDPNKFSFDS